LQVSVVHAFESLQSAAVLQVVQPPIGVCTQPLTALQLSVVHAFESLQLGAVPAAQLPVWQVSEPLHALPSVHDVPFVTAVFWHPVEALQVSVVHTFESLQLGGVPAIHVPLWQVSAPLHALPSVHEVPFASAVFWHPVEVLQESVVHGFESLQLSGVPAVQLPDWQVSAPLQAFPSEHAVPFATDVKTHPVAGLQVSVVQALLSLHVSGDPAVQLPV
jgi:hypothetical protein